MFIIYTMGGNSMSFAQTQDPDTVSNGSIDYDSLLLEEWALDSLTLIDLIDSLLLEDYRYSSLAVRSSYISDITNAGRDFGFNQYGFSAGLSYYHKSGLYGDLTGYWNSDLEPNYNPTIINAGYMGSLFDHLNYIASYEHYFYANPNGIDYPLTNAFDLTTYYDFKFIAAGVDYSFLFGTEAAHRIRPNIFSTIAFNTVGIFDEISLYPSLSMLVGNQNIYYLSENYQAVRGIIRKIGLRRFLIIYRNDPELIENLVYQEEITNVFGIMNYSFSVPVNFRIGHFSFSAGYFLNIPVALPGEEIDISPNHYFNLMALYFIPFRSKR